MYALIYQSAKEGRLLQNENLPLTLFTRIEKWRGGHKNNAGNSAQKMSQKYYIPINFLRIFKKVA